MKIMMKLITNELLKIFKRKNIYVLLFLALVIISGYSIFTKLVSQDIDIKEQYEKAYKNDALILENYENLNKRTIRKCYRKNSFRKICYWK